MSGTPTITELAKHLIEGQRAALSRSITLMESQRPEDRVQAIALLQHLSTSTQNSRSSDEIHSRRIGITGSPGVGKSTFIEAFGQQLLAQGHQVAVLAVDPSSSRTKGSILGDKTRMPQLSAAMNAYVRPSPAGQTLGGVARTTRQAITLCEAAGYNHILIETVGVGQSEHTVHKLCDMMLLLVLPGGGDELQGMKRGIVELADVVLVTKADGELLASARLTAGDYSRALHLQAARTDGWVPTVAPVSALAEDGLVGFGESLQKYFEHLGPKGIRTRRLQQAEHWFDQTWPQLLEQALRRLPLSADSLRQLRSLIANGQLSVDTAADEFVEHITQHISRS